MTAGSCSVMLLFSTRQTFFCHGSPAGSMGARRFGREMRFGVCSLAVTVSAESVKAGSRTLSPLANESAAGPVFRKVRRLSIEVPLFLRRRSVIARHDNALDRCHHREEQSAT